MPFVCVRTYDYIILSACQHKSVQKSFGIFALVKFYAYNGLTMLDVDAIKSRREKLGLTQDQAATKAGLGSRQRWNDIESGRKPNISMDTFNAIATALQCDPCDLLAKEARTRAKKG